MSGGFELVRGSRALGTASNVAMFEEIELQLPLLAAPRREGVWLGYDVLRGLPPGLARFASTCARSCDRVEPGEMGISREHASMASPHFAKILMTDLLTTIRIASKRRISSPLVSPKDNTKFAAEPLTVELFVGERRRFAISPELVMARVAVTEDAKVQGSTF